MNTFLFILLFISYMAFAARRLLTYMHAFQQEEYDTPRFLRWILQNRVFDRRLSLAILGLGVTWFFLPYFTWGALHFFAFLTIAALEKNPLERAKKKLALTARVKRILAGALVMAALIGLAVLFTPLPWLWLIPVQAMPLILVLANFALVPYEDYVQKKFLQEAKDKLSRLHPTIIGITGSFGKTSVKHILGHILKMHAPTLITPGSVNTPMGITRIIREDLDESHQYFVVEMGAYGPGSIARLCALTPPNMGIITAVGHAHYERFKTLDAVAETKYELAQAALEKAGHVIVHERTLRFAHARQIKESHESQFIVCGEPRRDDTSYLKDGDLRLHRAVQTMDGLQISLRWQDMEYNFTLPLYGIHHAHNAALAFAAARTLGLEADSIITALESVPQITHRLEVKKILGGTIVIDDAYNSNPVGFRCALELMEALAGPASRKILVTPGMVELGAAHEDAHYTIGQQAGALCDFILTVAPQRIPSFIRGAEEGAKAKIIPVASFAEASAWVEANRRGGDIILMENDLPDIYEQVPKL